MVGRATEPMSVDQQSNIDAMIRAMAETLFSAWSYFHLLQGFHQGSKTHPVVVQKFDRLLDQVWRRFRWTLCQGRYPHRSHKEYVLPASLDITQCKPCRQQIPSR